MNRQNVLGRPTTRPVPFLGRIAAQFQRQPSVRPTPVLRTTSFVVCFPVLMGAEVFTGLVGIVGAAVGGTASFAGTWANLRSQHKLANTTRRQGIQDRRYAAHLDFIRGVDRFGEAARDIRYALERGPKTVAWPQHIETAQNGHTMAWAQLQELKGAAELAGPPQLAVAVRNLANVIKSYSSSIDSWYLDTIDALSESDLDRIEQGRAENSELCRSHRMDVEATREQYVIQAEAFFSR